VEEVPGLAYRCVGLIHPRYTRGATGADGHSTTGESTALDDTALDGVR
jgi:hypothetical protein